MRKRCIARAKIPAGSETLLALRRSWVLGLHQEGLGVMTAVVPRLPACANRGEASVNIVKGAALLLENRRFHFPASLA